MKHLTEWFTTGIAIAASSAMLTSTRADTTLTTFDTPGFSPVNALYASWSSGTINATATNYIVTAIGYGSAWKQLGPPPINAAGNSNIVLDLTISAASTNADGQIGIIVDLTDNDNTKISYRWYGRSLGHHILTGNLFDAAQSSDNGVTNGTGFTIVTNAPGSIPGLDITTIWHLNMEIDPGAYGTSGTYTIAWNDLALTGSGGGATNVSDVCATIDAFDGTVLGGLSGNWTSQVSTPTNLQITATGWGDGWAAVSPAANTDSNKTLQANVTLTAPSAAIGKLGPIVVLQDGAGRQISYAWYGQNPGTNLVLSKLLSSGTLIAPATAFDFTTISFFHIQLDPSTYAGAYTVAWNDLSVIGCTNTTPSGNAVCSTLDAFDNDQMGGLYGNWTSQVSTPTNLQITASGYGGGWHTGSRNASTTSNAILRLDVTLTAPGAGSVLGPIVVLQDGDGTQMSYAWYGQNPGNHVLTSPLSAGLPVGSQPGTVPGFDFGTVSFFHIQLDPSTYGGSYTVAWNNLDIFGCAEAPPIRILGYSYDPASGQFTVTWTSEINAYYDVLSAADVTAPFNYLTIGIPSAGETTTATVTLTDPSRSFIRIHKE